MTTMSKIGAFLLLFFAPEVLSCNCPKNNASSSTAAKGGGWEALANLANYDSQLIKDYCRADFCLEASVKSDKSFIDDANGSVSNAFYNFKSVRYFRYKPSSLDAIESGLFLTPLDDCGVDIKSKGIYYLCGTALGPNAWVTACDFNKKFESLSFAERIFFLAGYKKVNCFDQNIDTQSYVQRPPQRPQSPPPAYANHSPQRAPPSPRPPPPPHNYPKPQQAAPPSRPNNNYNPNQAMVFGQNSPQRPAKETPKPELNPNVQSALHMFPMLTNFSQVNHNSKPIEVSPHLPPNRPEMAPPVERPVFADHLAEIPDLAEQPFKERPNKNDIKNEQLMNGRPQQQFKEPVFPQIPAELPDLEEGIRPIKEDAFPQRERPPNRGPNGGQRPAKYPPNDNYAPIRKPNQSARPEVTSRPQSRPQNEYWTEHQREPQDRPQERPQERPAYERPVVRATRTRSTTTTATTLDYDYEEELTTTQRAVQQKPNSPRIFDKQQKSGTKDEFNVNYEQFAGYHGYGANRPQNWKANATDDEFDTDLMPARRSALNVQKQEK